MKLSEARGKLIAIGGAEDLKNDCAVVKEFLRLAKGPKARVVVLTVATDKPGEVGGEYVDAFKALGVDEVEVVDVSSREDASDAARIEKVKKATGLYFTGGDQLHITSLLGGSEMQKVLHQLYERGVVVAGTSAGAAMMSNTMIIGGSPEENPRMERVQLGPGMDLIVGAIIDTHFSQRGRHGRLLTAVAHYPQDLGLGIDEDTAMVVDGNEFTVVGAGAVTVIDGGAMTYTNVPHVKAEESLALYDVRVHVLPAGHRYDLANRRPVIEDGPKAGGKNGGGGNGGKGSKKGKRR